MYFTVTSDSPFLTFTDSTYKSGFPVQTTEATSCRTRVGGTQIDPNFLLTLNSELKRIRRKLYFRIVDWVKVHPLYSLLITAIFGVSLNLIASIIFEKLKRVWPLLG